MKRDCPGSGAPANPMEWADWCPWCGRKRRVRNDGCLARHPMDYACMVEFLGAFVLRDRPTL